jgi:hypothetical protein
VLAVWFMAASNWPMGALIVAAVAAAPAAMSV